MPRLRHVAGTLASLFVDDAALAALSAGWVLIATQALPYVISSDAVRGVLLFAGLAAALVASALRRASRPPP